MFRRNFLAGVAATALAGCLPTKDTIPAPNDVLLDAEYVGRWVEVLLGGDGGGFELFEDGTAASINQPELNYVSWRVEEGKLFLTTAEAVGNAIKSEEVGFLAAIEERTTLRLSQRGKDWMRVFRRLN